MKTPQPEPKIFIGLLVGQAMENWLKVAVPAVLVSCERENMPTSSVPLEPLRVAVPI